MYIAPFNPEQQKIYIEKYLSIQSLWNLEKYEEEINRINGLS